MIEEKKFPEVFQNSIIEIYCHSSIYIQVMNHLYATLYGRIRNELKMLLRSFSCIQQNWIVMPM